MKKILNPLATKFRNRVVFTKPDVHDACLDLLGLTWRPGDHTNTFTNKTMRPLGAAVAITTQYASEADRDHWVRRMPVLGFRAELRLDGSVSLANLFMYDGKRVPEVGATKRVIDPVRNPSLLELVMATHKLVTRLAEQSYRLPAVPQMPRVWLGFPPGSVPEFQMTDQLLARVAFKLNVPVGRLGSKDPVLLQRMLEDVWVESQIAADAESNNTGLVLVDAELCHTAEGSLRAFEDFSEMLGVQTWNPAREVLAATRKNPAAGILKAHGNIDLSNKEMMDAMTMDVADRLIADMRRHLGGGNELFSDEEIFMALEAPHEALTAEVKDPAAAIAKIGEANVVAAMRALLSPIFAECCTDADLLEAAQHPNEALFASGMCKTQVIQLQQTKPEEALDFTPLFLGRRVHANLYRPWHRTFNTVISRPVEATNAEPVAEPGEAVSAQ
jgi:hypothetical protein